MLLHSPKLAERVLGLVTFFRDESVTEPTLRSVAILAAVREREAAYVWRRRWARPGATGSARRPSISCGRRATPASCPRKSARS